MGVEVRRILMHYLTCNFREISRVQISGPSGLASETNVEFIDSSR